jgi:hypothetical protein
LAACDCVTGDTRIVYTSIACCNEPPNPPTRPAEHQTCCNCQWVTDYTFCASASTCAL